jgi:sugar/nucleoside kinase (ribokinase family)
MNAGTGWSRAQGRSPVDVIAFGSVFLEIVFGQVAALPEPGQEIFADEFGISGGGAVTAATAASRGGARAGLATRLGDDAGSRLIEEHCRREGIDVARSQRNPGRAAGVTVVLNFDGDRAFVTNPPPARGHPDADHWLEVLRRHRPAWCYLHPDQAVIRFLREARALGTRIALDVNREEIVADAELVRACAALADIFLPNEDELLRLTGAGTFEAAAAAATWGPVVVVKRGGRGAAVLGPGGVTEVSAGLQPVRVRDRTGAGDAFAGALLSAVCQGAPIAGAAAAGNAAGSAAVARLGGVGELDAGGLASLGITPATAALATDGAAHRPADTQSRATGGGTHR